jgi:MYXO-CTERM domain-containing protein
LYNLDNYVVQPEESPILWFEYVMDITVTVTRTGDPTQADVDRMADRQGVIPVFIKARSSESGAYYREAFGIEEFRFQGVADPEVAREIAEATAMPAAEEAPGLAPVAVLALLGAVLLVRRRRR